MSNMKFCLVIFAAFIIGRIDCQPVSSSNVEPRYIVTPGVDVSQQELQGWTNTYVPLWQLAQIQNSAQPYAIGHYGANPPVQPTFNTFPTYGYPFLFG